MQTHQTTSAGIPATRTASAASGNSGRSAAQRTKIGRGSNQEKTLAPASAALFPTTPCYALEGADRGRAPRASEVGTLTA
jgi:hypothetical protein